MYNAEWPWHEAVMFRPRGLGLGHGGELGHALGIVYMLHREPILHTYAACVDQ